MPACSIARRAAVCVLALALALAAARAGAARADGDPASDALLVQDVFYPYQPKVSPSLEAALAKALGELRSATGVHLKIAIIGTAPELGLVPEYFGHPQAYARFLDKEISFNRQQTLLTVMPQGFGTVPASYGGALTRVPLGNRHTTDALTRSAILAVVALARGLGKPIATPSLSASSSGGGAPAGLVFGLPVALLALGGAVALRRSRARAARSDDERAV